MNLSGVHLLLTYQCNRECDHCFVWGSIRQSGMMTLGEIRSILRQSSDIGSVEWIYFEGGEPFLYYAVLLEACRMAAGQGHQVGVVTNGYWATAAEDAIESLRPFAGLIRDLSISSDLYHAGQRMSDQARTALAAAGTLGIPAAIVSIAQPEETGAAAAVGRLPTGEWAVRYRGRAAEKLVERAARRPWSEFGTCPYEDLREPGRVHVDPFGNVHVCQGIVVGNVFRAQLREICETYDPDSHPITGPLLRGGPAEMVRAHGVPHGEVYADACHLCYEARSVLRGRFPDILLPDPMYGVPEE